MKRLWGLSLVLALVACGRSATPAPARVETAPEQPNLPAYCEGYAGCAEEEVWLSEFEGKDRDQFTDEERAAFAAAVANEQAACAATWAELAPHQQAWVESCTGCGGSCDVYDCLDQGASIGATDPPFECDAGE